MALSRNNRIRNEADIRAILKKGKTVRGSFFFLKTRPVAHGARAVVIVSSKVAKTAVLRNRMKRVLGEIIRRSFIENAHLDLVCMVTKPFKVDDVKARQEVIEALKQLSP